MGCKFLEISIPTANHESSILHPLPGILGPIKHFLLLSLFVYTEMLVGDWLDRVDTINFRKFLPYLLCVTLSHFSSYAAVIWGAQLAHDQIPNFSVPPGKGLLWFSPPSERNQGLPSAVFSSPSWAWKVSRDSLKNERILRNENLTTLFYSQLTAASDPHGWDWLCERWILLSIFGTWSGFCCAKGG